MRKMKKTQEKHYTDLNVCVELIKTVIAITWEEKDNPADKNKKMSLLKEFLAVFDDKIINTVQVVMIAGTEYLDKTCAPFETPEEKFKEYADYLDFYDLGFKNKENKINYIAEKSSLKESLQKGLFMFNFEV